MPKLLALTAALLLAAPMAVQAEPTRVMVRAQALDAKFIGDHMGGVAITLKDARTGAVLAKGLTRGATGETQRIMRTPRTRGNGVTDAATTPKLAPGRYVLRVVAMDAKTANAGVSEQRVTLGGRP